MIIDSHAHWGPWFFSMETGSVGLNTELLDRFGIDVQIVSAIESVVYDAPAGNASLATVLPDEPRLRGYVTIDPRRLDEAEADLAKYMAPQWLGVKIHTHYHQTPISTQTMRDAVRLATEAGMPALIHTWGYDVVDLAELAAAVPDSRVIAGHMGANAWPLIPEARKRSDRIWFEPCWSQPEAGRVRWVLDQIGTDRFVFGTDSTLIDPSVTFGAMAAATLSENEAEAVFTTNAKQLFGL